MNKPKNKTQLALDYGLRSSIMIKKAMARPLSIINRLLVSNKYF
jgi:hypothetical protein